MILSPRTARPLRVLGLAALAATALAGDASAATNGKIAYVNDSDGYDRIFSVDPAGGAPTTLVDAGRNTIDPAWSPDGQRLTYSRRPDGGGLVRLYLTGAAGGIGQPLTDGGPGDPKSAAGDYDSAWSPDGKRLAFVRWDGQWAIYVANADGSGAHRVSGPGSGSDPSWSPDGTKIAYGSSDGVAPEQIAVVNADGGGDHAITATGVNREPAWSPDGTKIAFASNRAGTRDIYVMDADGANQKPLTTGADDDYQPAWAPDGTALAFTRGTYGVYGTEDIYLMNADGANPHALVATPARELSAAWAPIPSDTPQPPAPPAPAPAPPAAPAPAPPAKPAPSAKPVAVAVLPAVKGGCVAGGKLTLRVDGAKAKLKTLTVTVGGRKVSVKRGKDGRFTATAKLPKPTKATKMVKVVATGTLADGRPYRQARTYTRCR